MKFDIKEYSSFDNYMVKSIGNNASSVYDKLLRLTTKLTERYASDILYLFPSIMEAVENSEQSVDAVIMFRESGVSLREVENETVEHDPVSANYLQCWRLTIDHTKSDPVLLKRVYLCSARGYTNVYVGI